VLNERLGGERSRACDLSHAVSGRLAWFTACMPTIDHLIHANHDYAATFPGARPRRPKLRMAVIACMDSRLDLFGALGLDIGDAHLIRNAGGVITDDVLRSLALSQRTMGTREVVVIHHTECGMFGLDDDAFRDELARESGQEPQWRVPGFTDLPADVRESVAEVRACPWIPHREDVRGFVFDVATAQLEEII
jgi:carbonic anhydrase